MVDNSNYQNIVEERVGPVPTGSNLITQTCLAYLLQFDSPRDFGKTLTVDFAFLNYAVYYWLDHLETCISEKPSQTTLQMVSDFTISNQVPFANVAAIYARHSLPLGHEAEPMCGSPLYWAAHFGMSKVCGLLVVEGADINAFDAILGTPISAAIRRGHNAIVHILVNNGAELEPIDRVSPLHIACSSLNSEAVKLVLNSKVDVNAVGSQRMSALALAASAGEDGKIIQLLLDAGANVNEPTERENSALRRACERWVLHEYNDTAMMLLLNHGAVVPDGEEKTLLEAAVKSDDVHAIQLLVGSGVDVNIGIHAAAVFGKDLNVGLLHDLGANIDHIGGRYETTALCEAAYQGHENVVRRLLSHGAELDMQDKHGWITGEIASVQGHDHLITALPAPNLKARDSISTHKRPSHLILPAGSPSELTIHSDGITVSAGKPDITWIERKLTGCPRTFRLSTHYRPPPSTCQPSCPSSARHLLL